MPDVTQSSVGPGFSRTAMNARRANSDWVAIVVNPRSGTGRGRRLVEHIQSELQQSGWRAHVAWSTDERSALVARANLDPRCRGVVAVGGDGTLSALINELPRVPVTVVPAGTENLFAAEFGLSRSVDRILSTLTSGRRVPLDLGRLDDRRFALMAGLGFDADVITRHHQTRLASNGRPGTTSRAAYVEPILGSAACYRFPLARVVIPTPTGEETLTGAMVFLFNLPRYALHLPVIPAARGDDGWLDLVVFQKPGPWQMLRYLWMVLRGIHLNRPDIQHRRIRHARLEAVGSRPVPIQLDGDPAGWLEPGSPRFVEIEPGALDVLAPARDVA
jgi:diacylglycerol kinase (ATP)